MCGFAGIVRSGPSGISRGQLARMAAVIRHRGPDGYGFFLGPEAGLAHVRLSIVDVAGGAQPMTNEDGRYVVVFNGEIYNHVELRRALRARGHTFRTRSDTEVLVHGYEEWGPALLDRLNGQFAIAIYDRVEKSVFLARDRFGVRPLFHAVRGGTLFFASEVKAILASGEVAAAPDLHGLDQVFTFWAARPPRTPFAGVSQLEPGCYAVWRGGNLRIARYYALDYGDPPAEPREAIGQLDEVMRSSVELRMRADVPVGAYLSGGLDSSITCALAAAASPFALRTFSIAFEDPRFDERAFQLATARRLGSAHAVQTIGSAEIPAAFRDVVWHAETPLLRTAPVPMYLLSRLTREQGIKVVLTGEGADELFLGYDLFKEVAVRQFCMRRPGSSLRPRLFDRLYPYLISQGGGGEFWRRFFLDAGGVDDPLFSHLPRFGLTRRIRDFYSADARGATANVDVLAELRDSLPGSFARWSPLNRAAYLEMVTLLSPYLLASQGDRMGLAHGIEGRFPFLDHRLFEFAASLPTSSRLLGLREKEILRRWAASILPQDVARRGKQPYRAPDAAPFFAPGAPDYLGDLLSADALRDTGLFEPAAVAGLLRRCGSGRASGFRENQAFVGILSTQVWHHEFIAAPRAVVPLDPAGAQVLIAADGPEPPAYQPSLSPAYDQCR